MTNEKRVLRVLTNEKRVLPVSEHPGLKALHVDGHHVTEAAAPLVDGAAAPNQMISFPGILNLGSESNLFMANKTCSPLPCNIF